MATIGITIWWIGHLLEESDFDLYTKDFLFFLKEKMIKIHYISKGKKREKKKQIARFVY
jgi:hypothetical protein